MPLFEDADHDGHTLDDGLAAGASGAGTALQIMGGLYGGLAAGAGAFGTAFAGGSVLAGGPATPLGVGLGLGAVGCAGVAGLSGLLGAGALGLGTALKTPLAGEAANAVGDFFGDPTAIAPGTEPSPPSLEDVIGSLPLGGGTSSIGLPAGPTASLPLTDEASAYAHYGG
jgi:hypothetical protein